MYQSPNSIRNLAMSLLVVLPPPHEIIVAYLYRGGAMDAYLLG